MSNSDGATWLQVFSLIVTCIVPLLLGVIGWFGNELYQNLKDDLRECNRQLDGIHTKLTGVQYEQSQMKQRVDSTRVMIHNIDQKTGDTNDLKDRVNVIGRKVNIMDKSMQAQQESHGNIIVVLKEVVAKLKTFKQK